MGQLDDIFARYKKCWEWSEGAVWRAFFLALFLGVIIFPYWWLVVQWSATYFPDPGLRFTFITTTFLFVLIVVDSTFLIRYYQIVRKREFELQALELRHAEEALRLANRKLNLLSSITRHDIRNQLHGLKAFLELSKESPGDVQKMSRYITSAEQAADAIERQIAFTKEYEDLGVMAPVWQNLDACVKKVEKSLPLREVHLVMDSLDVMVYADPLLEKVFYNLVDNALRYGGEEMTMIRIASQESETGLVISLEDDGTGIMAEDKKRLFERGFGKHTGLGLFLSREILSITGISITENGEPGKGARFAILVPKGAYRFPPAP